MTGKVIVITGASDGIGRAAARELSGRGHEVIIVGRSAEKTSAVADELGADHLLADFADFASVQALAAELSARYPHIDVLANNAGGIFGKERAVTADGHEMTWQVNYLAPFLLTNLLLPVLSSSRGTVINTSSRANSIFSRFRIEDLEATERYRAREAYGNAKLAQILFTKELDRRFADDGLTSTAFHPGVIASGFSNEAGSGMAALYRSKLAGLLLKSPEEGADTLVFLAEGTPGSDYPSGEYFTDRAQDQAHALADDGALAEELWRRSTAMVGLA